MLSKSSLYVLLPETTELPASANAFDETLPATLITSITITRSVAAPETSATFICVVPEVFPPITSLSLPPVAKLTSIFNVPPPTKLLRTDKISSAFEFCIDTVPDSIKSPVNNV